MFLFFVVKTQCTQRLVVVKHAIMAGAPLASFTLSVNLARFGVAVSTLTVAAVVATLADDRACLGGRSNDVIVDLPPFRMDIAAIRSGAADAKLTGVVNQPPFRVVIGAVPLGAAGAIPTVVVNLPPFRVVVGAVPSGAEGAIPTRHMVQEGKDPLNPFVNGVQVFRHDSDVRGVQCFDLFQQITVVVVAEEVIR